MKWNPFSREKPTQKIKETPVLSEERQKELDSKYAIKFDIAFPEEKENNNPKKAYEWLEEKVRTSTGEVIKIDTRSQSILELLDKKLYVYAEAHDKDAQVYSIVRIKNPTDISEYKKQLEKRRLENFVQVYASTVNIETLMDHTFSVGGI